MNPSIDQEELWKKIDKVLWEDWDPIGVNDYGEPNDEYRSYVPSIYKLLIENKSADIIAQKLNEHVTKAMGLFSDAHHSRVVAEKLIVVKNEHLRK